MNKVEIVNVNEPCSINSSGDNSVLIANGSGGIVKLFFIDSGEDFPISKMSLNSEKYTLLVIDEGIKTTGTLHLNSKDCFPHSKDKLPNGKLVKKALDKICEYPVLICKRNKTQLRCEESTNAALGCLYKPEIQSGHIKLNYLIGKRFSQMFLNENPGLFNIKSSDQHNELDDIHWELKELDIFGDGRGSIKHNYFISKLDHIESGD